MILMVIGFHYAITCVYRSSTLEQQYILSQYLSHNTGHERKRNMCVIVFLGYKSPLNPEFFSPETSFSLYMPLMHRISILCLRSSTKTEPKSTCSLCKQTRELNHTHSFTSMQWSALWVVKHPLNPQAAFPARVPFSKPVHAARARIGPTQSQPWQFDSQGKNWPTQSQPWRFDSQT